MRDFPITFLFIISSEKEVEVVKENLRGLVKNKEMQHWDAVLAVDSSKDLDIQRDIMDQVDFTEGFPLYAFEFGGDFGEFKTTLIKRIKEQGHLQPYVWFCDGDEYIPTQIFPALYKVMNTNHSVNDNEAIAFPRRNVVEWKKGESAYDYEFEEEQFDLMIKDHNDNPNAIEMLYNIIREDHCLVDGLLFPDFQLRLFNSYTLEGFEGKVHEQPITKNHYRYAVDLGVIQHPKTLDERILSNTLYHNILHGGEA